MLYITVLVIYVYYNNYSYIYMVDINISIFDNIILNLNIIMPRASAY